jgi:hypothetical protein
LLEKDPDLCDNFIAARLERASGEAGKAALFVRVLFIQNLF